MKKRTRQKIRLGVNIDHCATLRQVRGGTTSYPDIVTCAKWAQAGGADLITIHLREDRRHIQDQDVNDLCHWRQLPINLELAAQKKMLMFALKVKPDWVCFVPEKRQELTTEGGLDVIKRQTSIKKMIQQLRTQGIAVSLFIAPDLAQVRAAAAVGAQAIELHTGHWVLYQGPQKQAEFKRLKAAAQLAHQLGLGVHAGHGLDPQSTAQIKGLPYLAELNIGHFLVCEALKRGLKAAVKDLNQIIKS